MLSIELGTTTNETYTYDVVGNRLTSKLGMDGTVTYTPNTSNEPTQTHRRGMSFKRNTPGLIEDSEDPRSRGAILRKRTIEVFFALLVVLMLTLSSYLRYTRHGSTDWSNFWIREGLIGGWLIFVVVRVFRKGQ